MGVPGSQVYLLLIGQSTQVPSRRLAKHTALMVNEIDHFQEMLLTVVDLARQVREQGREDLEMALHGLDGLNKLFLGVVKERQWLVCIDGNGEAELGSLHSMAGMRVVLVDENGRVR